MRSLDLISQGTYSRWHVCPQYLSEDLLKQCHDMVCPIWCQCKYAENKCQHEYNLLDGCSYEDMAFINFMDLKDLPWNKSLHWLLVVPYSIAEYDKNCSGHGQDVLWHSPNIRAISQELHKTSNLKIRLKIIHVNLQPNSYEHMCQAENERS